MKTLDEAIKEVLLERFNPSEVARTIIDQKVLQLVPFLNEGDCIEFKRRKEVGFELSISKNKSSVVVITKEEMLKAFNVSEETSKDWSNAINSLSYAFYELPNRSKYFKEESKSIMSPGDIVFIPR